MRRMRYNGRVQCDGTETMTAVALTPGPGPGQGDCVDRPLYCVGVDGNGKPVVYTFGRAEGPEGGRSRVTAGGHWSALEIAGCSDAPRSVAVTADGKHVVVVAASLTGKYGVWVIDLEQPDPCRALTEEGEHPTGTGERAGKAFFNAFRSGWTVPNPLGVAVSDGPHPYAAIRGDTNRVTLVGLDALHDPRHVELPLRFRDGSPISRPLHLRGTYFGFLACDPADQNNSAPSTQLLVVDAAHPHRAARRTALGIGKALSPGREWVRCGDRVYVVAPETGAAVAVSTADFSVIGRPRHFSRTKLRPDGSYCRDEGRVAVCGPLD